MRREKRPKLLSENLKEKRLRGKFKAQVGTVLKLNVKVRVENLRT
jgi:hypothetical protein